MKKWIVLVTLVVFGLSTVGAAVVNSAQSFGPAPNSGDGVSDGSDDDGGDLGSEPNSDANDDTGNGDIGPAPNAGDGVPDGSGMMDDTPNGPNG